MALYTGFLSAGVSFGLIISGLITIQNDWRVIYQVSAALIGLVLLLAFFTFPETAYIRERQLPAEEMYRQSSIVGEKPDAAATGDVHRPLDVERAARATSPKQSYWASLKIFHKSLTDESLLKLFLRPLGLICLPPVLWAALVESVTIGFLVAVTSNVDVAFEAAYGFQPWQVGLCFFAAVIGSIIGIPAGGHLGDVIADYFTKRNGGIRDPEMRLPAMIPSLIAAPLALVLYGAGIQHGYHWICPTIGLGLRKAPPSLTSLPLTIRLTNSSLVNFAVVQGTNIALVYVIDAYRPVAGEITLAVMGFKSMFGFLLSFYTNQWTAASGYQNAYGVMAAISAVMILGFVPLYFWGKHIRHVTWSWPVISYIHWGDDREVGE